MMLILVATAFVACEDVILTNKPVDVGGSTSDTTGSNEQDSSNTADSTDRDTARVWTALEVTGPILNLSQNIQIDVESGFVLVLWESGVGKRTVWGRGKVIERGRAWRVVIEKPLPEKHWVKPEQKLPNQGSLPPGLYGLASVVLCNTNLEDGRVVENALPFQVEFWGELANHLVIYDPGESRNDPAARWLDPFRLGYNLALPGTGSEFVPDNDGTDPYTIIIPPR